MYYAHVMGSDPFGVHELILLAVGSGITLAAAFAYVRGYVRGRVQKVKNTAKRARR